MPANLYALGAIALWAGLASLGLALRHVPPFLLTGIALVIGSVPAWPLLRQWKVPPATLLLGVGGLFGYHFLLFIALRTAPAVEANLVNYLWPLLIVVLAPLLLRGLRLQAGHVLGAFAFRRLDHEMLERHATKRSASAETPSRRLDVAFFDIDAHIFAIG